MNRHSQSVSIAEDTQDDDDAIVTAAIVGNLASAVRGRILRSRPLVERLVHEFLQPNLLGSCQPPGGLPRTLYAQHKQNTTTTTTRAVRILSRSTSLTVSSFSVLLPLLHRLLHRWLRKQRQELSSSALLLQSNE